MGKNTKCIVVGEANRAGSTRNQLEAGGISTMAIAHNSGVARIVETCAGVSSLQVIAVFCRDFPMDWGTSLFGALRKALGQKVSLHALVESKGNERVMRENLEDSDLNLISFAFPFTPANAEMIIRQKWFTGRRTRPRVEEPGNVAAQAEEPATVSEGVFRAGTALSMPTVSDKQGKGITVRTHLISDEAGELPLRPAAAQIVKKPGPKAGGIVDHDRRLDAVLDVIPVFNLLSTTIKRNAPLPPEPVVISIVGKGGTTVAMDPRRIRPLPDNPRMEDNPGLTEESLRGLGEGMKSVGQLQDILVCPIVGDSQYDAQLIDGERRLRSGILAGIMLNAKVREDVTPEMVRELYVMSVVRNVESEPFTTLEYVRIVARFRGPEFQMTQAEVGKHLNNRSQTWVMQMEHLGRLHPEVQKMLGEGSAEDPKSRKRKLSTQIALLLIDIEIERQLAAAQHIVERGMNYVQARRYVLGIRRGLGLASSFGGRRKARQFDSLRTFASQSLVRIDTYLDMPTVELYSESRSDGERSGLCQDLLALAVKATEMAGKIKKD